MRLRERAPRVILAILVFSLLLAAPGCARRNAQGSRSIARPPATDLSGAPSFVGPLLGRELKGPSALKSLGPNFLVADMNGKQVILADANGKLVAKAPVRDQPLAAISRADGSFLVASPHSIARYSSTWKYLGEWNPTDGSGAPAAFGPSIYDIAEGPGGRAYVVSDSGLSILRGDVLEKRVDGTLGPGQRLGPWGIVRVRAGEVCVSDRDNKRLVFFGEDGSVKRVVTLPARPWAFDFLPLDGHPGFVVVTESGNSISDFRIAAYDANGRELYAIGEPGTGYGQYNYPDSVLMSANGRLIVSDYGNRRLLSWTWQRQLARGQSPEHSPSRPKL